MSHIKTLTYYYSSFSGKAGRAEFCFYFMLSIAADLLIYDLHSKVNVEDKTVMYMFYIYLIILLTFIPVQAAVTRRLRYLEFNTGLIILNFIPLINLFFKIYLSIAKIKSRDK